MRCTRGKVSCPGRPCSLCSHFCHKHNRYHSLPYLFLVPGCSSLKSPIFWTTVCKTVRPMLSDRCLSCPVCTVGVLWPNGWMDHDETWHAGRPRPWPHCVRCAPSSLPMGHSPQFSAHICCGQMAGWIKTPLGREVDLGPCKRHCVRRGLGPLSPKKGAEPPNFRPVSIVAKRSPISATAEHSLAEVRISISGLQIVPWAISES